MMLWIKAFHIIFVVTWFAGIFYLPRLFVYHAMANDESDEKADARFKIMERKLFYGIMTPSGVLATVFGFWMIALNFSYYMKQPWMHAKLLLVFFLWVYHLWCIKYINAFKHNQNTKSHVFYRWFNEVPVFILIAVVILVVVQPVFHFQ